MRKSPVTVQQWVDTLPSANITQAPTSVYSPQARNPGQIWSRDLSLQSDDCSSLCSSVESVLEMRKPDPEAVLLGLGFGPPSNANNTSRIPSRFLQPSKILPQIDFHKFLEQCGQKLPEPQSCPASPARPRPKSH